MMPFVIAGLAAGAVLLIAVGVAMSGGGGGVSSRLERYASARGQGDQAGDGDEERESVIVAGLSRVMETQDLSARLGTELARADLKLRPAEFVAFWIACPFVFVVVAYIVGFVIPTLQNPIALAL